jgi:hypothetical protein
VFCTCIRITHVPSQAYDFILSINGETVGEDLNPNASKLVQVEDGFILQNVAGIRTHVVSRLDGKGYDIVKRTFPLTQFAFGDELTNDSWGRLAELLLT